MQVWLNQFTESAMKYSEANVIVVTLRPMSVVTLIETLERNRGRGSNSYTHNSSLNVSHLSNSKAYHGI